MTLDSISTISGNIEFVSQALTPISTVSDEIKVGGCARPGGGIP